MLKSRIDYGAITAKVLTMYGRLLKGEDWDSLYACKDITEIHSFLRGHRGWSEVMSSLPPSATSNMLQNSIKNAVFRDFKKVYYFSSLMDKEYLRCIFLQTEYEYILEAMREKCSYQYQTNKSVATNFMYSHSKIDFEALWNSKNFSDILNAVKGSIYEKPLFELKLNPDTGMPNYWETRVILENQYYQEVFSFLAKKYKGKGRKKIEKLIGTEADLMNIVSIIRLHRSFPASLEKAEDILIPVSYKLNSELIRNLLNAKNEQEVFQYLGNSTFRDIFFEINQSNIDDIYHNAMEKLCRKLIKSADTDMGIPQAYLILKELECKKLNRLIESKRWVPT